MQNLKFSNFPLTDTSKRPREETENPGTELI